MLIERAQSQLHNKRPFVLYRSPNKNTVIARFQHSDELHKLSKFTDQGFVFAPFDTMQSPILLKNDEQIVTTFEAINTPSEGALKEIETVKEEHINLVAKGLKVINSGDLKKVVLSRRIHKKTNKNCFEIFQSALSMYPSAFCYLWFHPKVGCWLGATPEQFLAYHDNKVSTTALAGTIEAEEGLQPIWGRKEREEQQLVTDFLVEQFSKMLNSVFTTETESVRAGKLWHLKTQISGTAPLNFSMTDLIKSLHPTPAVCGVPKEEAYRFILDNEPHDREFYTGYLGPLNEGSAKTTNLFVNLRCMKIEPDGATLFIGGGITEKSIPAEEWLETQRKSQTMLALL